MTAAASHGRRHLQLGEYAGRAVYRPHHQRDLKEGLFHAIGHVVEVRFVGVVDEGDRYQGQNLYQECRPALLQSSWVPEEDLEFLDDL